MSSIIPRLRHSTALQAARRGQHTSHEIGCALARHLMTKSGFFNIDFPIAVRGVCDSGPVSRRSRPILFQGFMDLLFSSAGDQGWMSQQDARLLREPVAFSRLLYRHSESSSPASAYARLRCGLHYATPNSTNGGRQRHCSEHLIFRRICRRLNVCKHIGRVTMAFRLQLFIVTICKPCTGQYAAGCDKLGDNSPAIAQPPPSARLPGGACLAKRAWRGCRDAGLSQGATARAYGARERRPRETILACY
jgi:hypothetical protein